jgi:arsenate reductase
MNVLVLCTGNSCRSIIAEALINSLPDGITAKSAGSSPGGKVNLNAVKVLQNAGVWDERYYSKSIDEIMDEDFDLVITVCDNAKEACPVFPAEVKQVHIPFEDPDGKDYEVFEKTLEEIKQKLLPAVLKYYALKQA